LPPIADVPRPAAAGDAIAERFEFTGIGSEYFRIWAVNLVLTLATLGIYSAWAKVRKTRYFWQNTRIDGCAFDFHGRPIAILRGRLIALALLVAYTWSLRLSAVAVLAMVALLCGGGPWLFLKSQQFKLRNSSHRGLRFGFAATEREAYKTALPPLVLYFSSAVFTAIAGTNVKSYIVILGIISLATVVLIPAIHHRLKAFQHGFAMYGDLRFAFTGRRRSFYAVYAAALGMFVLGMVVAFAVGASMAAIGSGPKAKFVVVPMMLAAYLSVYFAVWPFMIVRLQRIIWRNTAAPGVVLDTTIRVWPMFKIMLRNVVLTIVTLGLYWPYASIAIARYRVKCMRIVTAAPIADVAARAGGGESTAIGDAAADAFGFDLGL
jgi:uncharacterized membrane protein YjgN (DUF898 family)